MNGKLVLCIIVVIVIIVSIVVNAQSLPANNERTTTHINTITPVEQAAKRLLVTPKHTGKFISKGEAECRRVLERIYSVPFPTVHPEWLRSTETKRKLELDCYAEIDARRLGLEGTIAIACEYNGEHHDDESRWWNDEFKRQLCEAKGVHLIIVPYTVRLTQIKDYITRELDSRSLLPN